MPKAVRRKRTKTRRARSGGLLGDIGDTLDHVERGIKCLEDHKSYTFAKKARQLHRKYNSMYADALSNVLRLLQRDYPDEYGAIDDDSSLDAYDNVIYNHPEDMTLDSMVHNLSETENQLQTALIKFRDTLLADVAACF